MARGELGRTFIFHAAAGLESGQRSGHVRRAVADRAFHSTNSARHFCAMVRSPLAAGYAARPTADTSQSGSRGGRTEKSTRARRLTHQAPIPIRLGATSPDILARAYRSY